MQRQAGPLEGQGGVLFAGSGDRARLQLTTADDGGE